MEISRNCTRILSDARAVASASVTAPVFYGKFAKIQWRPYFTENSRKYSGAFQKWRPTLPYGSRRLALTRATAGSRARPRPSGSGPRRRRSSERRFNWYPRSMQRVGRLNVRLQTAQNRSFSQLTVLVPAESGGIRRSTKGILRNPLESGSH